MWTTISLDEELAGQARHTLPQGSLHGPVGAVGPETLSEVCSALAYALGC